MNKKESVDQRLFAIVGALHDDTFDVEGEVEGRLKDAGALVRGNDNVKLPAHSLDLINTAMLETHDDSYRSLVQRTARTETDNDMIKKSC